MPPSWAGICTFGLEMKLILSSVISISLAFSPFAYAERSCEFYVEAGFTPSQAQALADAKDKTYKIEIVNIEVDGILRTIALVGEEHLKSDEAYQQGQAIVQEFSLQGVEQANSEKTWGGRFFRWVIGLGYLAHKIFDYEGRKRGSTIQTAVQDRDLLNFARQVVAAVKEGRMSIENADSLVFIAPDRSTFRMDDLIKKFGLEDYKAVSGTADKAAPTAITRQVFNLEEGHRPGYAENIQSVTVPLSVVSLVTFLSLGMWHVLGSPPPVADGTLIFASAVLVVLGSHYYLNHILGKFAPETKLFKWSSSLENGLLDGRNETIATKIRDILKGNPTEKQMLVIVGSRHVPGIKSLLESHK